MSAALLVRALRQPATVEHLDAAQWNGLIAAAKAERLIATLAWRVEGMRLPEPVQPILRDARMDAAREARQALWEADRAAAALAPLGVRLVVLKGTAYAAAGLVAGQGRFIGDLDILVPRSAMSQVEPALMAAGWEWVKEDAYDDAYYRQWMHELPPMIHVERDRMIDVHHTILPLTARPKPDADALLADAVPAGENVWTLSPEDRVIHAAAHIRQTDLSFFLPWRMTKRWSCAILVMCPDTSEQCENDQRCHNTGRSEDVKRHLESVVVALNQQRASDIRQDRGGTGEVAHDLLLGRWFEPELERR